MVGAKKGTTCNNVRGQRDQSIPGEVQGIHNEWAGEKQQERK